MKKKLAVFMSLLVFASSPVTAFCEDAAQTSGERLGLPEASDFDEETNSTFDFRGYTFQVPEEWDRSDSSSIDLECYYAEIGLGTSMLQVSCIGDLFDDYSELYEHRNDIINSFGNSYDSFEVVDISEYEIAGTDGILFDFDGSAAGMDVVGNMIAFVDESAHNTILLVMINSTGAEYSHFDDFYKIADAVVEREEPSEAESEAADDVPMEYDNALRSAQSYLEYTSFSYSGLIDQLEYEGYSSEACTYAVDNCGADWNEQALKSAESYLEYSSFSYSGLIGQLEYEGFSTEQATYGVDNCGADWNEQAAKTAESYLEYSAFSRQELLDQLIYEGFSAEQAEYGVAAVGY